MSEPRETRVSYHAIAKFTELHNALQKTRKELAKTKAAEEAYNAASAKGGSATSKNASARSKALATENVNLKAVLANLVKYRDRQKSVATAVAVATKAIQAQNRALKSNAAGLTAAAAAANDYADAQRRISRSTGTSSDAIRSQRDLAKAQKESAKSIREETEVLRENAQEKKKTHKANVQFVEAVGDVNTATGEVVETTEEATRSTSRWAKAMDSARQFLTRNATDTNTNTAAQKALTAAKEKQYYASENLRIAEMRLSELRAHGGHTASRIAAAELSVARARKNSEVASDRVADAVRRLKNEGNKLTPAFHTIENGGERLYRSMERFANWRPRLVPPFIALIPIIGAVIAAINPLIAIMGALGGVAIGLAGSIGSLSGAFLALPGILSGVVAGIASVVASMGGVGNVFKTYAAMQKATNSAKSGKSQAERAEELSDAERGLAKAQRNVQKAQENLNKARQRALKDLIDLRIEVSRASLNEERAVANLRKAQEDYWNVMADPGSTLGDKLDAAASVKEAEADLQDVRKKNIENQKKLNEAEKKGVNGSEDVLDAQERLTDAYEAQSDAQRRLGKVQRGETNASAQAVDEYNKALDALSPSARKFVLALLAMEDQWKSFRLEMQETFFSQFVGEVDRLPRLLNNLRNFLLPAAKAMGQFVKNFMILMDSKEWSDDFKTMGEINGRIIEGLGKGFLSLLGAIKDIMIAAGPFTEWMVNGFAEGAENFRQFVGDARETGKLAEWLDKVAERMKKWWEVVKNVGATIFNYSAAAESFGGWVLDGLLETTKKWKEASEEARKENSKFKQWLENIKPLLSEIKGLMGDIFGYFQREMMDPQNIEDARRLVELIRDDLGPAVGRLLDALADTNIDEKFVSALASIIDSLATIMENGGGEAFETFFDVVEGFFSFLADVTEDIDPDVLAAILKFIGGLAAVAFIGKFTGITALLGGIRGLAGQRGMLASLGGVLKNLAKLDGLKFGRVAGFFKIMLKAAGPVGLAIAAIMSFFENTVPIMEAQLKYFMNPTDEMWKNLKETGIEDGKLIKSMPLIGMGSGVLHGIDGIFGSKLGSGFDQWLEDISRGFDDFITNDLPSWWGRVTKWWDGLIEGLKTGELWTKLGENVGQGILDFREGLDGLWKDTKANIETFQRNWDNFWGTIEINWNNFWDDLKTGKLWENLEEEIKTLGATLKSTWEGFWNGFKLYWNNSWAALQLGFKSIVANLGNIWTGVKNGFAAPLNWVIENVWNKAIVNFWNGMASRLGMGTLSKMPTITFSNGNGGGGSQGKGTTGGNQSRFAEGGVLPGYTPGRDVHTFQSPTAGTLHLSGGEAIMRPEFTKMMGGKPGIDAINKRVRQGRNAFAFGGVYKPTDGGNGRRKTTGKQNPTGVADIAGDIFAGISGFFGDPVKVMSDGLKNAVAPFMGGIGTTEWAGVLRALPGRLITGLVDDVKKFFADNPGKGMGVGSGNGGGEGMGWEAQWSIIKKVFPWATLNSAYRSPSANAAAGGVNGSYHTRGRAIDTTASMEIFNWIRANFPNSKELIYSPAGGRQLQNGQSTWWGEPVRSMHWDHVHWAMKEGGVIPGLYDNGGWLPDGGLAVNKSGKPEAVLDPQESRALKALLSGTGLGARPASLGTGVVPGMSPTTQVIDNSVNIDKLIVQNPVPEKLTESLPRAIRRAGYMNSARTEA